LFEELRKISCRRVGRRQGGVNRSRDMEDVDPWDFFLWFLCGANEKWEGSGQTCFRRKLETTRTDMQNEDLQNLEWTYTHS
jgi:hypothetical protein